MIEIRRGRYHDFIRRFLVNGMIKVITGMRRVGKSVFLRQLASDLSRSGRRVHYIDRESFDWDHVRTAADLVAAASGSDSTDTLIVDEVQTIDEWERAAASLSQTMDVLVAGSNAALLSGELATRLAGRTVRIPVYPLSLSEFRALRGARGQRDELRDDFRDYLRFGGLPGLLHGELDAEVAYPVLRDIFDTIVLRDVIQRHAIRNPSLLEAIARFAMDNIGSLISAKRIADFLKSQRRATAVDTVLDYLRMLCEAYVLHRVPRFDIRGRRHLEVNDKFYLGDIGLRYGLLGYRESDIGGILENLVYLELRRRGYDVSVGTHADREIDFVATRPPGERLYIQVAYLLERPETIEREIAPLLAVGDAHPKQLLTLDEHQPGDLQGITHRNIPEWLSEDA